MSLKSAHTHFSAISAWQLSNISPYHSIIRFQWHIRISRQQRESEKKIHLKVKRYYVIWCCRNLFPWKKNCNTTQTSHSVSTPDRAGGELRKSNTYVRWESNIICILIGIEICRNSINFRTEHVFSVAPSVVLRVNFITSIAPWMGKGSRGGCFPGDELLPTDRNRNGTVESISGRWHITSGIFSALFCSSGRSVSYFSALQII